MADLARLAGVSVATVSRALNGSAEVSIETRERVAALAQQHNYTVNLGAKNLRTRQNRTVAVVIPYDKRSRQQVSDPFYLTMLGSLADALTERGYDMLLSRINDDDLGSAGRLYDSGQAIGVVLIGQGEHHEQLNRLAERHVPLVVWGGQMTQQHYCSVGSDNISGGRLATRHLLERGCQRIVFIGDPRLPEVALRLQGHQQALAAAGRAFDHALLLPTPFAAPEAGAALNALIERGVSFDAVFACSDVLAMAALQVLRLHQRAVPQQVAVVGFDDIEWASHSDPPLTTVRQPIVQAGVAMVDTLLELIAGTPALPRTLALELVVRQSSLR